MIRQNSPPTDKGHENSETTVSHGSTDSQWISPTTSTTESDNGTVLHTPSSMKPWAYTPPVPSGCI